LTTPKNRAVIRITMNFDVTITSQPYTQQPPNGTRDKPKRAHKTKLSFKNIPKIAALRKIGCSTQEVAQTLGVDRTTLWKFLKDNNITLDVLKQYESNLKNEILISTLDDLNLSKRVNNYLSQLPDKDFEELNLQRMLDIKRSSDVGFGIKMDKFLAKSGLPTQIIAYVDIIKARQMVQHEIEELDSLESEVTESQK
jgi:transcriptional regulator with XRE-family HTH domain